MTGDAADGRLQAYQAAYLADDAYEQVMVRLRHRLVCETAAALGARRVLEVGVALDPIGGFAAAAGLAPESWTMVEPAPAFAANARRIAATLPFPAQVVEGFLEERVEELAAMLPGGVDLVVFSSLLHEVERPDLLLSAARGLLASGGRVHANVPNALSLHRRLGRVLGLLGDEHDRSERNDRFAQVRNFDPAGLAALFAAAGYRVVETGGCFLKLLSNRQMGDIPALLAPEMLDGLYRLGHELPELSADIYVNAAPA